MTTPPHGKTEEDINMFRQAVIDLCELHGFAIRAMDSSSELVLLDYIPIRMEDISNADYQPEIPEPKLADAVIADTQAKAQAENEAACVKAGGHFFMDFATTTGVMKKCMKCGRTEQ